MFAVSFSPREKVPEGRMRDGTPAGVAAAAGHDEARMRAERVRERGREPCGQRIHAPAAPLASGWKNGAW